jgi:hypothetical protein
VNLITRKAAAIKLGLANLFSTDTFVISYPKSGNTWLRFIIANMLTKETVTMKNVDGLVPDIYNFKDRINQLGEPRFIKSHHAHFKSYPKTIYIYRDYRDVLISYYHFQKGLNQYEGDLSSFIKQIGSPFGKWEKHVTDALEFSKKYPDRILLLSYNDMLINLPKYVELIANYCSIKPLKSTDEIVRLCSFNAMQQNEAEHGRTFDTPGLTFFRSGKAEQWRKELSEEDNRWIVEQHRDLFSQLNLPTT